MSDLPNPRVGTAVVIWRDGKFLMGKRKGSHGAETWCTPGGHLEFGESLEDCVAREALEEAGVKIKNIRFFAMTNDIMTSENKHYVTIWMEADWDEGEPQIMEPDKYVEQGWYSFKTLPSPLFKPYDNLRIVRPELFS